MYQPPKGAFMPEFLAELKKILAQLATQR